jgi:hypothetical protein
MKKIIVLLTAFIFILSGFNSFAQSVANIAFEKLEHDFGKIKEDGGPAVYDFKFTNSGTVPLIISAVNASCGCTTPEWSKEPVLPGKPGFIKVSYNPLNRPGNFTKTVTVVANIPNGSVVLKISGDVTPKVLTIEEQFPSDLGKIRMVTNNLSFVKIKNTEVKTDSLQYYNPGSQPVKIAFKSIPPFLQIKVKPEIVQPKGKGYFVVTYDAKKVQEYGFQMNRIYLIFDGVENYNQAISVSATVEEDFSKLSAGELANAPVIDFDTRVYEFGEINEGVKAEHTFKIINKGKSNLLIRSVKASCGCTAVNPASNVVKPGESTDMKAVFDSQGKLGMQNKTVTIISNDPANPTTILRITGTVKNIK